MSINRIMSNGVMGMLAQSQALGTISGNIANAATVGYKRSDAQFETFVQNDRYGRYFEGAGVRGSEKLRTDQAGSITTTEQTTNAAIVGNGFFLVQEIDSGYGDDALGSPALTAKGRIPELTRAGDFYPDKYGHLVNGSGRALLGVPLGNGVTGNAAPTLARLELVSTDAMDEYVEGSTRIDLTGNLAHISMAEGDEPTNAIPMTVTAVDSDGNRAAVDLRFVQTAQAEDGSTTWEVYGTGARYEDGEEIEGAAPGLLGTMSFGPGGILTGGEDKAELTVDLNLGGNFEPMSLVLGRYGSQTGLRSIPGQTTSGMGDGNNGIAVGAYRGMEITDEGFVRATYQGGQSRDFYRIPNATVANATDLETVSGTAFRVTRDSGDLTLKYFGSASGSSLENAGGGAAAEERMTVGAALISGAVEASNSNIEGQFTALIQTQRCYSSAAKIVSTADEMTQTVVQLKG